MRVVFEEPLGPVLENSSSITEKCCPIPTRSFSTADTVTPTRVKGSLGYKGREDSGRRVRRRHRCRPLRSSPGRGRQTDSEYTGTVVPPTLLYHVLLPMCVPTQRYPSCPRRNFTSSRRMVWKQTMTTVVDIKYPFVENPPCILVNLSIFEGGR